MLLHVPLAWFWALPGILHTILHSSCYTLQYCKVSVREWAKNALFQHWNVCSCWEACLTWNDGLSLKHIQCFLLTLHDCLPTLWLDSYFNLDIQAEGSELQASTSLFYSLMPSFSSMPIFGVVIILLDLLDVIKTVIGPLHPVFHLYGD